MPRYGHTHDYTTILKDQTGGAPAVDTYRLLEDGSFRLLEDGSKRLLE